MRYLTLFHALLLLNKSGKNVFRAIGVRSSSSKTLGHVVVRLKLFCVSFLFFVLASSTLYAQQEQIDSLFRLMKTSKSEQKMDLYKELAYIYYNNNDYDKAFEVAESMKMLAKGENKKRKIAESCMLLADFYNGVNQEKCIENAELALEIARDKKILNFQIKALNILANNYLSKDIDQSKKFAEEALELASDNKEFETSKSLTLNILGNIAYFQSEFQKTLSYWRASLTLKQKLGLKQEEALLLNNMGVLYRRWSEYDTAINCYHKALEIQEELGDKENIARSFANIGNVYFDYGIDYDKTLDYYNQALELFQELGDSSKIANIKNSIGLTYREKSQYDEALVFIRESLEMGRKIEDEQSITSALQNMVDIYIYQNEYEKALVNLNEAQEILLAKNDKLKLAINYHDFGRLYLRMRQYNRALENFFKAEELNKEINTRKDLPEIYQLISEAYTELGKTSEAFKYYKQYTELKDTIFKENYLNKVNELETKYDVQKKEQEIQLQKVRIETQDLEVKKQRVISLLVTIGLAIVVVFSFLLFKQFRAKQKANHLLQEQNEEIRQQRDQIFQQKQEITDSIRYASKIQRAILPPESHFHAALSEYFILYRPRDIVSGDFYWVAEKDDKVIIVAADCTGHGVPGAFMSMLGTAFLNEIVIRSGVTNANLILDNLRDNVVRSLHQTGKEGESQDGMDLALVVLDPKKQLLEFAGAFNPLYLIRDNELTVYKADKMPIGIHRRSKDNFDNNVIAYQPKDVLYIFSDGYADQFGGPDKRKFMTKHFRELLFDIHKMPMEDQRAELERTLEDWKMDNDQVDDILVMGFRL